MKWYTTDNIIGYLLFAGYFNPGRYDYWTVLDTIIVTLIDIMLILSSLSIVLATIETYWRIA